MQENKTITGSLGLKIEVIEPFSEEAIHEQYPDKVLWKEDNKGNRRPNENSVAHYLVDLHRLKYFNETFFGVDGEVSNWEIRQEIQQALEEAGIDTNVDATVNKILNNCKNVAYSRSFALDENIIPFANGNLYIKEKVFKENEITTVPHRFKAKFIDERIPTPYFNGWMHNLFVPDDIEAILQYLGYCLVYTTKADKALFLVGRGGAGKSGIGVILSAIFGNAIINVPDTKTFLGNRFMLPELAHAQGLYDDDLDNAALTGTGLYKKLVTMKLDLLVDKKSKDPFRITPKAKLIACCNEMITSLYDKSDGFYRRLHPVSIKPMSKDFIPNHNYYDYLREEADGIAQKALTALYRLIDNGWKLHESQRTRDYIERMQSDENPLPFFLKEYTSPDPDGCISTTALVDGYVQFCHHNGYRRPNQNKVPNEISDLAESLGMKYNKHLKLPDGTEARGYTGRKLIEPPEATPEKPGKD